MALLEIPREDAAAGNVPAVCIKCGADATEVRFREFRCYPWQTSVLALFHIEYEPARYRLEVGLPFCRRHRNYWHWADRLRIFLPFLLIVPVGLAEAVLCALLFGGEKMTIPWLVAFGANFVAWLVWNEWRDRRVVRAVRISAAGILLRNVADEVVERWYARADEDTGQRPNRASHLQPD